MNELTLEEKRSFRKKLISIVLPIALQNFMFGLVPVSDSIMLAVLDQDSVSAVNLASQFFFVLNLFISAFISGASLFASQYWGKKDIKSIEKLYGFVMSLIVPVCIIFFVGAMFFPGLVMKVYTDEPAIIEYGCQYLKIASFFYIFDGITQTMYIFMKNTNMVKSSTVISVSTVVLNIIFNALFIYGIFGIPKMGARGAALGTTLSCLVAMVVTVFYFGIKGKIKFHFRDMFKWDRHIAVDFRKYVSPIMANSLSWGLGFTALSVIMGHMGSDAVAANSIVAVVKDLISCFAWALGSGGGILVGNLLGEGNLEKAKQYGSRLCKLAISSGLIAGVILVSLTPLVLWVVNMTETAEKYLMYMMIMCVYYMVGRAINCTTISGIFTAGGDTRFGFICDTVTMWVVIVPIGALAAFVFKLPVLWVYFLLNLDEIIKLPVVYHHYKQYKWVKQVV